jgi:hypothetical protein
MTQAQKIKQLQAEIETLKNRVKALESRTVMVVREERIPVTIPPAPMPSPFEPQPLSGILVPRQ